MNNEKLRIEYIYINNKNILEFNFNKEEKEMKSKYYVENKLLNNKDIVSVPPDSNCLIHSIMVYII